MKTILIPLVAILCIASLLAYSLSLGIDGALFGVGATLIGGIAGYRIKAEKDKTRKVK